MVGGNLPGRTPTIPIEIYNAVEAVDHRTAHVLSAGLLIATVIVLVPVYTYGQRGSG